jgi:hypothetical protein
LAPAAGLRRPGRARLRGLSHRARDAATAARRPGGDRHLARRRSRIPELAPWITASRSVGAREGRLHLGHGAVDLTLPSIASLLTSLHPSEIGLFGDADDEYLPRVLGEEHQTLAEAFRDAGYRTVGVVNQIFLTAKYGFDWSAASPASYTIRRAGKRPRRPT